MLESDARSVISTQTFRRALTAWTASVDKECPFSGVTKSGRVWRKVPESDARSVISTQTFRRTLTTSVDSCVEIKSALKLQALVYILPSTTAIFSYAIGSRTLSANEQFFCWCSNSSKFVTNDSNKTRRVIYSRQQSLHQQK